MKKIKLVGETLSPSLKATPGPPDLTDAVLFSPSQSRHIVDEDDLRVAM